MGTASINNTPKVGPGRIWPSAKLVEYHQVIDNIQFVEYENRSVINEFTQTITYSYNDDQRLTLQTHLKIDGFRDSTSETIGPVTSLPENTPVYVWASPNINYVWQHGKIVPDTTPRTVARLEHLSNKSENKSHMGLVIANAVVVAILIVLLIFRQRRAATRFEN